MKNTIKIGQSQVVSAPLVVWALLDPGHALNLLAGLSTSWLSSRLNPLAPSAVVGFESLPRPRLHALILILVPVPLSPFAPLSALLFMPSPSSPHPPAFHTPAPHPMRGWDSRARVSAARSCGEGLGRPRSHRHPSPLLCLTLPPRRITSVVVIRCHCRCTSLGPSSLSFSAIAIALRRRYRCPSSSSSLSVIVFVVVRCLLRFLSSSFPSLFGSFPPTSLWSSLPRRIVVSPLVVFSGVIWSWWRGQRQGHGKMDNENELRQTSWLAFRDSPMGLPTSWVPLRLPPSTDPPSNESEPPTSLWKGQGQW